MLSFFCFMTSSFASCDDFDFFLKNRSGETLTVISKTPNHDSKVHTVATGTAILLDRAVNEHWNGNVWSYVRIFKIVNEQLILVYEDNLVKDYGSCLDSDSNNVKPIRHESPARIYDPSYKVLSEKLTDGYPAEYRKGERGQWKYTVTR